jgi:hypothetical protein
MGSEQMQSSIDGPYAGAKAITPSDSADLPDGECAGILCTGTPGNVVVVLKNGDQITLAIAANWAGILRVRARRVRSTSTTATGLFALYV